MINLPPLPEESKPVANNARETTLRWRILVVDDEPDVHAVTRIALKRRQWQKRGFDIVSANSAAEAKQLLNDQTRVFHVILVDVVMEEDDSGLMLCRLIRKTCPSSVRIVLRTGQPGKAPEEGGTQSIRRGLLPHKGRCDAREAILGDSCVSSKLTRHLYIAGLRDATQEHHRIIAQTPVRSMISRS